MNTVSFAEGGGALTWGIEAAPPDRRRVGTIEQRQDGYHVSPGGPAADLVTAIRPGPYRDLYEAMDAIAFATGGACEKSQSCARVPSLRPDCPGSGQRAFRSEPVSLVEPQLG